MSDFGAKVAQTQNIMAHLTSQSTFEFKNNCLEEMEVAEGHEKNNAAAQTRKHNIGVSSLKRCEKRAD